MTEFLESLAVFVTDLKGLPPTDPHWMAVFLSSCALMGALAIIMDWSHFLVRRRSLMNLAHGLKTTPLILLGWVIGATIGGFFGQVLDILQATILASLTAGVGWPLILTKVLEQASTESANAPDVVQA